ncbi:MAG: PilZ domain-containing protein [Lachnospiraceae bacterium]|nr:PilZ domain-containing protein [Lachnospiraceae bacterium]
MILLTNCTKCSIYNLRDEYICDAQVYMVDETNASLSLLDDFADSLLTEVHVTFYDGIHGLVSYLCSLSDYKEMILPEYRTYYSIDCILLKPIGIVQRRSDIKVKTNFTVDILMLNADDQEVVVAAAIRDISAGGFFFDSTEDLNVGSEFSFIFKRGSMPLLLKGIILRKQEMEETHRHGYGCEFVQLSAAKEAIIREFVFREQVYQKNIYPLI